VGRGQKSAGATQTIINTAKEIKVPNYKKPLHRHCTYFLT
jgi:hypothetical protein